jgi:hypothetical protein
MTPKTVIGNFQSTVKDGLADAKDACVADTEVVKAKTIKQYRFRQQLFIRNTPVKTMFSG